MQVLLTSGSEYSVTLHNALVKAKIPSDIIPLYAIKYTLVSINDLKLKSYDNIVILSRAAAKFYIDNNLTRAVHCISSTVASYLQENGVQVVSFLKEAPYSAARLAECLAVKHKESFLILRGACGLREMDSVFVNANVEFSAVAVYTREGLILDYKDENKLLRDGSIIYLSCKKALIELNKIVVKHAKTAKQICLLVNSTRIAQAAEEMGYTNVKVNPRHEVNQFIQFIEQGLCV